LHRQGGRRPPRSEPKANEVIRPGPGSGRPALIEAVVFDAAGTLIRPREPVGDTYARVARAHGVEIPAWRLDDAFRRVLASAPPMVFPGVPAKEIGARERAWWRDVVRAVFRSADQMQRFGDFELCFAELFAHYAEPAAWQAVPGARAALDALRAEGRRLAVASNFDQRLPALLAGLGLAPGLEGVLLPSALGAAKPDPAFFAAVAARLGVAPAAAAYVGDDPEQDVAAARRAGFRAIDASALANLGALPDRIRALEETPHR
jgi:putative hydrolase of the HAD superfamily